MKKKGIMIVLAWPETTVYKTGAWYDPLMELIGVCKKGYYQVGHAALVLVCPNTKVFHYFDFGRYHTPIGTGRVRDQETDPELTIPFQAKFSENGELENIPEILLYLKNLKATHGQGKLVSSLIQPFDFEKGFQKAKNMQKEGAIPYGPFLPNGTNCSRFVAQIAKVGSISTLKKWKLIVPYVGSHSPISNVKICASHRGIYVQDKHSLRVKSSFIQKIYNPIFYFQKKHV